MLDKSKYSFLIGVIRQLETAIRDASREPELAIHLESLALSLALLRADYGEDLGGDDGGLPEGVDDDDAPGDDTPLGAALARIKELESERTTAALGVPRRLCGSGESADSGRTPVGSERRRTPLLRKGKRRGKK